MQNNGHALQRKLELNQSTGVEQNSIDKEGSGNFAVFLQDANEREEPILELNGKFFHIQHSLKTCYLQNTSYFRLCVATRQASSSNNFKKLKRISSKNPSNQNRNRSLMI